MRPFSYQTLFVLSSWLCLVRCLPANNAASIFISDICTSPTQHFNSLELSLGKDFCSLFLHISPSTTTVLSPHTTYVTAQTTATDTVTTSIEATVVTDVINYNTVTQTLPPTTDTTTLPAAMVTETVDVTNTINDVSTIYTTRTVTNINNNVRRQNGNGIFVSYAESVISTACSCLVTTPVITKTVQTTVVQTTTDINTQLVTTTEIGTTTDFSTNIDDVTVTVPGATIEATYTPSPVTVDVTSTATTTTQSTATDVVVVTDNESYVVAYTGTGDQVYASEYILGTSCSAYLGDDPNLDGLVYSAEQFASHCASDCTGTSGCVSFAVFTYIPGGGQVCVFYTETYPASSSCLSTYQDYGDLTVYNLESS